MTDLRRTDDRKGKDMDYDENALEALLEQSNDLHADAMRSSTGQLAEAAEIGHERLAAGIDPDEGRAFAARRTQLLRQGALGAGAAIGLGAAILALAEGTAAASSPSDVQILQTQQSLENLAIFTYGVALTLPFIGGRSANPVVKAFVQTTRKQHQQHDDAFGKVIKSLGGKPQNASDPVLLKVVGKAKPTLTSATAVVKLAIELEQGAAQTYVRDTSLFTHSVARNLTAEIMGVEAQHVAVLLAVQALLEGGAASDITLPPPAAKLPAAAGSVGFPDTFYPTAQARPETEGALR